MLPCWQLWGAPSPDVFVSKLWMGISAMDSYPYSIATLKNKGWRQHVMAISSKAE